MSVDAGTIEMLKQYCKRHEALKSAMNQQLPIWRDIRDFLGPRTARFPGEKVDSGTREDLNIINTMPRYAVRALPAGMQSGVTSPMRPWFRLSTPDPDLSEFKPVKVWLNIVESRMRMVMGKSNMYDRLKSCYNSMGLYGTTALHIEESQSDVIRAYDFPTGSYGIATNAEGRVDTTYRWPTMTAMQMVGKFGKRAPQLARQAYDRGDYENVFDVLHVIEPNRKYSEGSAISSRKKIASIWIDPQKQDSPEGVLNLSGYDDAPNLCPRWEVLGENNWGTGCGEVAIGDAKQLQLMEKRKLQGMDKNASPTMLADASMRNQRVSNLPNDTVYVNGLITGKPGYQPAYVPNPYIKEYSEEIQRIETHVDEAFYKNLFLMVAEIGDQPNITATQINTMREEKLMMLGPVLERLNDELLDPLIDVVFSIMQQRGMFPPPPEQIQGMPLRVEYISVLAQAQKAMGLGNIERFVGFVEMRAAVNPQAYHKLNVEQAIEEYGDGIAISPKIIRSAEEVQKIVADEAQKQAQQMALPAAESMAKTAKTASEIDLKGDNPVSRALQAAGAGA